MCVLRLFSAIMTFPGTVYSLHPQFSAFRAVYALHNIITFNSISPKYINIMFQTCLQYSLPDFSVMYIYLSASLQCVFFSRDFFRDKRGMFDNFTNSNLVANNFDNRTWIADCHQKIDRNIKNSAFVKPTY